MGDISEKDISGKDIYWVPLLIRGNRMGTLSITPERMGARCERLDLLGR